jgi:DNA (cytosine-5)-methyltransferase 1
MGYHRAGFEVVGVDVAPQPRYPFEFVQADALGYLASRTWLELQQYDALHASPPCQAFSVGGNMWAGRLAPQKERHPDYLAATRDALEATGLPWVIENVPGAPLRNAVTVCGYALGLGVKRHRLFESNRMLLVPPCHSSHRGEWVSVFGGGALTRGKVVAKSKGGANVTDRSHVRHAAASVAMGIGWMTRDELSQAIPPAYTELVGSQMLPAPVSVAPPFPA